MSRLEGELAASQAENARLSGYCFCGCGSKTAIAKRNNAQHGHVKGRPVRYVSGHHGRGRTRPNDTVDVDNDTIGLLVVRRDGQPAGTVLVDRVDYPRIQARRWALAGGYAVAWVDGRNELLHRELLGLARGDGKVVDHIDHNPLNNRRSNLRIGTAALNAQNRKPAAGRYRGVTRKGDRWRANCKVNNRSYDLGLYDSELEAARVASEFRRQHMPFSEDALAA